MWSLDAIADAIAQALAERERELHAEQSVHGLDALQEVALHPLFSTMFAPLDVAVLREQRYPNEWMKKTRKSVFTGVEILPRHSDRQRCDVVLVELPATRLDDRLVELTPVTPKRKKAGAGKRSAKSSEVEPNLFEAEDAAAALAIVAADCAPDAAESDPHACQPEHAFWLEIKVVTQHGLTDGVLGPNRTYASELTRGPLADLAKLSADERIKHGAAALVLFTDTEATARHDLAILCHKALNKSLPVSSPVLRSFPVLDRLGNGVCTVCLIGVRNW